MLQAATRPICAPDEGRKRDQGGGMSVSRDDGALAPDGSAEIMMILTQELVMNMTNDLIMMVMLKTNK